MTTSPPGSGRLMLAVGFGVLLGGLGFALGVVLGWVEGWLLW